MNIKSLIFTKNLTHGKEDVVLYGSVARGEVGERSDLDVYVIARGLPESPIRRVIFLKGLISDAGVRRRVSVRGKTPRGIQAEAPPLVSRLGG